jgi:hypothetical protein
MLALDTPVSLETHLSALQRNGRTDEMLKLLGDYQRLRVSPADRARLRTGEWHRVNNRFVPIRYDVRRIDVVGRAVPSPPSGGGAVGTPRPTNESDSAWLSITNTFTAQPLQFRLQVVPTLAAVGATNNITLLRTNTALSVAKPPMPGALASRTEFAKPLDLLHHRALAVTVRVDNLVTGAVLNVQLEAGSKRYRDHYLDLNFTGEKTLIIPEPTTGRMLPEFRPAHANYAFKAAMYDFNYRNVVALNLRWMRAPVPCRVELVEALAETDTRLVDPQIGDYRIPARLGTGDYIECRAGSPVRVFDGNGRLLASPNATGPLPQLGPGANRLRLGGAGPAAVKFTLITAGAPAE